MDFCWGGMFVASVLSLWGFHRGQAPQWYQAHKEVLCAITAIASFRAFDLLVNAPAYAPFGPANWGGRYRNRDEHCRVMLLTMMNFGELIFWYSVLFTYLAWFCGGQFIYPGCDASPAKPFIVQHALLLAMSTIMTVGYGTVAPNDVLTTVVTGVLSLSGLLLIAVGIAAAVSFAVTSLEHTTASAPETTAVASELSPHTWTIRLCSPLLCSAGLLVALHWLFSNLVIIQ